MSGVFQNIDPPPPSPLGDCVPPCLWCGGRTHSLDGKGVWGQYFIRRQTLPCTLHTLRKYFVQEGIERGGHEVRFTVESGKQKRPPRHRVHRVVTAAFWRTFHHEVKISLAGKGGGCTPTPFHYIYPHQ
jgi:hypothetical protein